MTQVWIYQQAAPSAGRKLLLLERDEITLALPLIYRLSHPEHVMLRPSWFVPDVVQRIESPQGQELHYSQLVPALNGLVASKKNAHELTQALSQVNQLLNQYFSDLGWRMVRRELSQIKKRQKKSHIEVSKDIISRLKHYMETEHFDSFDQALDNLLSEHSAKLRGHVDDI